MSIPGFTAKASLYSNGRIYRAAPGRPANSDGQTVVAQFWQREGCGIDCLKRDFSCRESRTTARECNQQFAECIQECPRYRN